VDDDPNWGDMLRTAMQRSGIDVTLHSSAMSALAEFREHPDDWDALITDQVMPGMKGFELVRAVKALNAGLPCIVCTGYMKGVEQDDLRQFGVSALLHKPAKFEQIINALADIADDIGAPDGPSSADGDLVRATRRTG
jgi:DNA-binding NtrC family response regulator